jgi:ATP-dependent Zn protease
MCILYVIVGMVMQLPDSDQMSLSKRQMLAKLDICMGGRYIEYIQTYYYTHIYTNIIMFTTMLLILTLI